LVFSFSTCDDDNQARFYFDVKIQKVPVPQALARTQRIRSLRNSFCESFRGKDSTGHPRRRVAVALGCHRTFGRLAVKAGDLSHDVGRRRQCRYGMPFGPERLDTRRDHLMRISKRLRGPHAICDVPGEHDLRGSVSGRDVVGGRLNFPRTFSMDEVKPPSAASEQTTSLSALVLVGMPDAT